MATDAEMRAKLILELQDEMSKALESMSNKANKQAEKTQSKWQKALTSIKNGYSDSLKKIQAGQQKFKSGMGTIGKAAIAASPFILMAKQAAEFDEGMREVATLTDMTVGQFRGTFDKVVESTQVAFGKSSQDVIKAFYDGISAGVEATEPQVKEFLDSVGKLAIAGKTEMTVAGDAITSVVNAYGKGAISMGRVSDILFAGVREGKTTVGELSASIGQVAPVAAALGVNFEELTAIIATLTSGGLSTAEAATQVKAGLTTMIKFSKQAEEQISKLGIKVDATTVAKEGMFNTIVKIDQAIKKNIKGMGEQKKAFGTIFNNVRALQPAMALTGTQAEKFAKAMDATKNSTGAAGIAFKKMQGSLSKYREMQQKAAVASRKLGDAALPILIKLAEKITPLIEKFGDFIDKNKEAIDGFMRLSTVLIGLKIGVGVFQMLHGSILMLSNPIGLAIVGIAGIGFAINALSDETTEAGKSFATAFSSFDGFIASVTNKVLFLVDIWRKLINISTFGLFGKFEEATGMSEKVNLAMGKAVAWEDRIAKREQVVEKGGGSFLEQFLGFNNKMKETVKKEQQTGGTNVINPQFNVTVQGGVDNPEKVGQTIGKNSAKEFFEAIKKQEKKQQLAKVF